MVSRDVVVAKVAAIRRSLARIRAVAGDDPHALEDPLREESVVLNLQRAPQSAIDLASHLVAESGHGAPTTLKEPFDLLRRHAGLDEGLANRLQAVVGFRKVAVHAQEDIDVDVVKAILGGHLGDLVDFASYALRAAGIED